MTEQVYGKSFGGTPAENYQRLVRRWPTISSASLGFNRASACSMSRAAPVS